MILQAVLFAAVSYLVWSLICLEINVRKVKALDVPFVRLPIDSINVPWTILQPHIWKILDRLPIRWASYPDFIRFARRGWHFAEKSETHVRLGPVWALVTPAAIYLHFADPDAIQDIFQRRSDFIRPVNEYKLLEVYGPCISTAGWDDWPRHRKVLAAPFNEGVMKFVWDESLRQAKAMLHSCTKASEAGIPSVQKDTRTLSLNVLAATGFRKSYEFHGSTEQIVGGAGGYRDSLQTVLDNVILLMLIPYLVLSAPVMPKSWVKIGHAAESFKKYMMQMLDEETTALNEGRPGAGGIMTSMVRALDTHHREAATTDAKNSKDGKRGLSVDEIFSNLFVINFAGHDTTANTLAFAMLLLAEHPEVQAWMSEEICSVTENAPLEEWTYNPLFSRLIRCRAVLLETLRLYPPIMALPKWTSEKAQTLKVGGRTLIIPPGIGTIASLLAIQTHPKYWSDPYVWRPSRWVLQNPSDDVPATNPTASEFLLEPEKSVYFPWSDGPQNCPGKKFAEVEAVAVLACLFQSHYVIVKREAGESEIDARNRVENCVNDVNMEMLLRMTDADRVRLICRKK
ncbi:MAG: hypothetical protein Q9227_007110 [Pyrenula ochraceoflavens]